MASYFRRKLTGENISAIVSEISGSFGDIGTFLPFAISLSIITNGKMDFNAILLFTGIFNILNGFIFHLPMPLQPMKAIAAEVITQKIDNLYVICSAGLVVGAIVFAIGILLMLGLSNEKLESFQNRMIPRSLISGIQAGLGLGLCKTGACYIHADYEIGVPIFLMMLVLMGLSTPVKRIVSNSNNQATGSIDVDVELNNQTSLSSFNEKLTECSTQGDGRKRVSLFETSLDGKNVSYNSFDETNTNFTSAGETETRAEQAEGILSELVGSNLNNHRRDVTSNLDIAPRHTVINAEYEITRDKYLFIYPIPVALVAFAVGLLLALLRDNNNAGSWEYNADYKNHSDLVNISAMPTFIHFKLLDPTQLWTEGVMAGGLALGLAQLPLTSLNSVVSISDLSEKLFGPKRKVPSVYLAVPVGLTNILLSFLGSMSVCHGAGGLAAQYKFRARTGWSIVFLGTIKIIIALAFGANREFLSTLTNYPHSVLGAMLIFVGSELCLHALKSLFSNGKDTKREYDLFVFSVVVGVQMATNTGWGFLAGLVAHITIVLMNKIVEKYTE